MNSTTGTVSRRRFTAVAGVAAAGLVAPQALLIRPARAQAATQQVQAAGGDALQMLAQEHRTVEQLLEKMLDGQAGEQQRSDLLMQLQTALNKHAIAEEAVVYPAMRKIADIEVGALEAVKEHADIQTHLFTLAMMPKNDSAWADRVRELQETVVEHVKEEEQEWFPSLREKASADQLKQITMLVQRAQSQCSRA